MKLSGRCPKKNEKFSHYYYHHRRPWAGRGHSAWWVKNNMPRTRRGRGWLIEQRMLLNDLAVIDNVGWNQLLQPVKFHFRSSSKVLLLRAFASLAGWYGVLRTLSFLSAARRDGFQNTYVSAAYAEGGSGAVISIPIGPYCVRGRYWLHFVRTWSSSWSL